MGRRKTAQCRAEELDLGSTVDKFDAGSITRDVLTGQQPGRPREAAPDPPVQPGPQPEQPAAEAKATRQRGEETYLPDRRGVGVHQPVA